MTEIWNIIVKSNTLNFLILIGLFGYIFYKINIGKLFINLQKNIQNEVDKSVSAKNESEIKFKDAKNKLDNIEKEISKIIENAQLSGENLSKNIISQADDEIKIIENNTKKIIENDYEKTKRDLIQTVARESLHKSVEKIKTDLLENNNLHQKFIDEAIEKIDDLNPEDLKI